MTRYKLNFLAAPGVTVIIECEVETKHFDADEALQPVITNLERQLGYSFLYSESA